MKEFASRVMKQNKEKKKINQKEIKEERKEISCRERAKAFSKTIHKPWMKSSDTTATKEWRTKSQDLNNSSDEITRDPVERRKKVNEIIERLKLREK